jgi:hypothetical protein
VISTPIYARGSEIFLANRLSESPAVIQRLRITRCLRRDRRCFDEVNFASPCVFKTSMRADTGRQLVIDALDMAWFRRSPDSQTSPKTGLTFHSDRALRPMVMTRSFASPDAGRFLRSLGHKYI